MKRGPYRPKVRLQLSPNGAQVGDKLLSNTHGTLTIVKFEPAEKGVCSVVCSTRGGDEIDLSAAYAGKLAVL